jgi:hypothetical protein
MAELAVTAVAPSFQLASSTPSSEATPCAPTIGDAIVTPLSPVCPPYSSATSSKATSSAPNMVELGNTPVASSLGVAPTQFLFDAIDNLTKKYLCDKWTGSIKFRALPVLDLFVGAPLDVTLTKEVDICDYLGPLSSHHYVVRLYLDPVKYDKPPLFGEPLSQNPHWIELKIALEMAAFSAGSPIMCNGGRENRTFKCKLRNRLYKQKFKKDSAPREDDCINMDKGGRRREGRSQSKRTRTTQALTKEELCPFSFTVKWDAVGFYIILSKSGFGCPNHANHLKGDLSKLSLPMQLLPEKEREMLQHMSDACIGAAVGRNYVFSKLGKFITKAQIAYFTSEPSLPLADGVQKSDTDSLLEFFEATEDISYHTLWDVPLASGDTALISSLNVDRKKGFAEINHTDDPDFIVPRESAQTCRQNPRVPTQARIFIAVAWANKFDIRTFMLFPEVFHADCTCDTNNTNNHLLTFSCRTSTGKQIVFLRVWLPNQKRFTFRWVFKFVLTSIFDTNAFRRTRLVMVDGDPQQRGELAKAILDYMPIAIDGGCGWHIVNQGWKNHGPGKTAVKESGGRRDKYNLFKRRVKDWCYSWMTPGSVESEEEYYVSKQLLFAYLASPEALAACDGQQYIIEQVADFVRNYVIVYDNVFLFYKKKFLRYFNVKTSSAHEGTNFGIKEHAAAVLPSHKIDVAGKKLSLQATLKGAQLESESTYMASSQSLWSHSPTANHVTNLAESIISRASARTHDYSSLRTTIDCWEVHYIGNQDYTLDTDRKGSKKHSPIPFFQRIRVVNQRNGFLCCNCGGQERIGLTCVHTMVVMESCYPEWKGPSHHDVSPRWWVTWLEFAHKPKTQSITTAMLALMESEVPGPRLPGPLPTTISYSPASEMKSARKRVKNYSQPRLARLVSCRNVVQEGHAQRTSIYDEGLTQESYVVGVDDQDSTDDLSDDEAGDNIFADSLLVDDHQEMSEARDILKPQINEVLQCLDTLKTKKSIEKATNVLNQLANELRLELGSLSGKKRNIDHCRVVNINVEENVSRKNRTYASKNC